jgi:transmembrane sensor
MPAHYPMENNAFSKALLEKYLAGHATEAEKAIVEGWYNKELSRNDYTVNAAHMQETENAIWQSIQAHRKEGERSSSDLTPVRRLYPWKTWAAVAASIAILVSLYLFKTPAAHKEQIAITAPVKVNNLIELPDGSIVILDKGSKLRFPKTFEGKKTREVQLTGNAYFDVKSNSAQQFVVRSGKITTTVLGTSFDINTNNATITVHVISGKVKVATDKATLGNLEPNHQIKYEVSTDQSSFSTVDVTNTWETQDVQLNDITFDAICRQLEQRYHINIDIRDGSLKEKKFTITLTGHDELNSTLTTVCDFNGAKFTYDQTTKTYIINAAH